MTNDRTLNGIFLLYALALLAALFSLSSFLILGKGGAGGSRKQGSLAIVQIYGAISTRQSSSPWGAPDADDIARRLHRLSEDDNVKVILLRINSPGGTVGAVQEIYTEILRCKSKGKKVVASLGDVAASGGYYLASAADRVIANPGSIVGSIGVILEFGNLEGLFTKLGVRLEVIKSGAHKDIGSPARPLTPEERALLQASIDDTYEQFVAAVSAGRKLPAEKIRPLADGRIFTGRQALQVGLVDEMGNREDAIQRAIQLGGLPAHPAILEDGKRSLSSLLRTVSSELPAIPWFRGFSPSENDAGPALEYRWR
jgi:protease IV